MQTKMCKRCHQEKPLDEFHLDKKSKDGRQFYCKRCRNSNQNVRDRSPATRARRALNAAVIGPRQEDRRLRRKYRITLEVKTQMCKASEWKCYLCRREIDFSAHVDECPVTGKIRGILCAYCNRVVMGAVDAGISPHMVLAYLDNPLVSKILGEQQPDPTGWVGKRADPRESSEGLPVEPIQ